MPLGNSPEINGSKERIRLIEQALAENTTFEVGMDFVKTHFDGYEHSSVEAVSIYDLVLQSKDYEISLSDGEALIKRIVKAMHKAGKTDDIEFPFHFPSESISQPEILRAAAFESIMNDLETQSLTFNEIDGKISDFVVNNILTEEDARELRQIKGSMHTAIIDVSDDLGKPKRGAPEREPDPDWDEFDGNMKPAREPEPAPAPMPYLFDDLAPDDDYLRGYEPDDDSEPDIDDEVWFDNGDELADTSDEHPARKPSSFRRKLMLALGATAIIAGASFGAKKALEPSTAYTGSEINQAKTAKIVITEAPTEPVPEVEEPAPTEPVAEVEEPTPTEPTPTEPVPEVEEPAPTEPVPEVEEPTPTEPVVAEVEEPTPTEPVAEVEEATSAITVPIQRSPNGAIDFKTTLEIWADLDYKLLSTGKNHKGAYAIIAMLGKTCRVSLSPDDLKEMNKYAFQATPDCE